jgi:copper chaperone
MDLLVPRLNCGGCVRGVTRAVQAVDPQATVVCDLTTQHVHITSTADPLVILASLAEVGYPGRPLPESPAASAARS